MLIIQKKGKLVGIFTEITGVFSAVFIEINLTADERR
jgi:hypothetical protein